MCEVIALGETMACFTPAAAGPLRYVPDYRMRIAGAESNLAIGLAKLGHAAAWVSRLGSDEFGRFVRNQIRSEGVDCGAVCFDPVRPTGVMFKQTGAGETAVYYYRAGSAASAFAPADLPPALFCGAKIFFCSGITPLLSESCRQAVDAAVQAAHRDGAQFAFDPNIRRKLWKGPESKALLAGLLLESDIVLAGLDELQLLLDVETPEQAAARLRQAGRARQIAVKDGANGAWAADGSQFLALPPYPCRPVDPIGAGDAFDAAFLAGILENRPLAECGRMGAVAGALSTQTPGDTEGYPDRAQLEAILSGRPTVYR
jgi:2-dehydro-3-deoxygluconokinase